MYNLTYEQIIELILEKSVISKEELDVKINSKLKELSDLISKEGAAHIVANELGVKIVTIPKTLKIRDVLPGMRLVGLTAKVINLYETREFVRNGKKARVSSMLIGDESGTTRLVLWDETQINSVKDLKESDILKIRGAYCKENNGYKELHLGNNSQLIINPEGESVGDVLVRQQLIRKNISDLNENDSVEIIGTVVQLFEPRFYEACPECGKKVKPIDGTFKCDTHNTVIPKDVPLINFFFDDSTANIRVVLFRDQVLNLLEKTEDELQEIKNSPEKFDKLKSDILGKQLLIRGRTTKNEMFNRLEFVANYIQEANPVEIAQTLSK
ncbi:MAG: DUF2240 family protein [Nanoarchaeota archaeon]|nr:DUF2240 family protein [Nanoarchaeota archaeon]MBU0962622.1 DUF2240 family protein [Nanoarchaeota archaeon]